MYQFCFGPLIFVLFMGCAPLNKIQESPVNQTEQKSETDPKKVEYKKTLKEFDERVLTICRNEAYAPIFVKSPCNCNEITDKNQADVSKITSAEKEVFLKYRAELKEKNREHISLLRSQYSGPRRKEWADYLQSIQPSMDDFSLNLANKRSTWGEYNKIRKTLCDKTDTEQKHIFKIKP